MVAAPFLPRALDPRALDAPKCLRAGVVAGGDSRLRCFHRSREDMKHTDDEDSIGAAIQGRLNTGRLLVATIDDAGMGKDERAAR